MGFYARKDRMGSKIWFFKKWAYVSEFVNGSSYVWNSIVKGYVLKIIKMTLIKHVSKHISLRLLIKFPNNPNLYFSFNKIDVIIFFIYEIDLYAIGAILFVLINHEFTVYSLWNIPWLILKLFDVFVHPRLN